MVLLSEINEVKDAFRQVPKKELICQESDLLDTASLIRQLVHREGSVSGLLLGCSKVVLDNEVGEVGSTTCRHVLTYVENLHLRGREEEPEHLAFLLAVRQSADSVKVPQGEVSIAEEGGDLPSIWGELGLAEVATLLRKQGPLLADRGARVGAPQHTRIVGQSEEQAAAWANCRTFDLQLVVQVALDRLEQLSVQGVHLQPLLFFQHDEDLVCSLLADEDHRVRGLAQVSSHDVEAIVRDLEQSDLAARVCN